ncbi:uncharacterized protein LOC124193035 [Daphnia pulex]|uniref:uncharacterized protein LOC124193035 n=1 Tax=Daphnia pulex TaxID=6669 RepID=UPI001EDD1D2D|nr:uncharacterized protein LOC124193035 [Daphnia pulex]
MSTSGSMDDDLSAIVTRLSKELEMMGLPGLASSSSYQQQVDYGGVGAIAHQPAEDVISDLINSSYDLIGLLRDLQRSKRQREDHAQQLIHDLQRSQWLLDKEKELGVQREREAAEAYEKERQANVRLQLSETLLKKKSEEHRQLAHESQLKENQWLHALRRRDQENHRLHQQLLKFLHSKSTGGGGGGTGMVQVEMRGSLGAPARTSSSDSTRLRKQWDRTAAADDAKKLVEAKWKMALNSLEKDHGLLRADYFQLVEMVGRFLTNCSTKLTGRTRSADTRPFANVTEWIQLPVVSMRDRLEQVFQLVEAGLVSTTFPVPNQLEIITDRQQHPTSFDSLEIDYVMPIIGQPLLEPETVTTAAAHQQQLLLPAALLENQKVATNNCISPIIKDEVVGAPGVTSSRNSSSSSAISTAATKSASAAQQRPLKMVKSIVQQQHSTTSTTGHQFNGGLATDPYSSIAFRNNNSGRTTINNDESSSQVAVNQVDWNETDSPPAAMAVYSQKSYSLLMGQQQSTSGTSSPIIGLKENEDGLLLDEMAITLDTPCPSASNSRSGSCSSTSSISSCKSQQQDSSGIDPCAGIDEQFLRTCSDAASLVSRDNSSNRISGPSALKSGTASTSLNLNRRTITARVRFVQPQPTTTSGDAHHHPGDPVDLQCCLITPPPPNS